MEILHWALVIISIPFLVLMVLHTIKRAKALSERIEEYHEEQESSQAGPANPYESLAGLYRQPPEDRPRPH